MEATLVCQEPGCSVTLKPRSTKGLCRRHYDRKRKRELYAFRKERGLKVDAKVGLIAMGLSKRLNKVERAAKAKAYDEALPPAGRVVCRDCSRSFWTEVPHIDAACIWCRSIHVVKVPV